MDSYNKIIHLSNVLYNDGLEKANVRDLSGAAESLGKGFWDWFIMGWEKLWMP